MSKTSIPASTSITIIGNKTVLLIENINKYNITKLIEFL